VDEKDSNDLMSTLGFKKEEVPPEQKQVDGDKKKNMSEELDQFDIDNSEADLSSDSKPVPKQPASEEKSPEKPSAEELPPPPTDDIPPTKVPSDASYLLDSDFSDFTVDERLISNYRTSLTEREQDEQEDASMMEKPVSEQPSGATRKPVSEIVEEQPPAAAGQPQATFYLVELYRSQGLLERALNVLETLKTLDADQDRIERESLEIRALLGEELPPEEPVKEEIPTGPLTPAEPEPVSPPEEKILTEPTPAEIPIEAPAVKTTPEIEETAEPAAPPETVAEPPAPEESAEEARQLAEEEYERRRVEALKRRMSGETVADELDGDEESLARPEKEDDAELQRIAALMKRAGSATVAPAPEQPAETPKPEAEAAEVEAELTRTRTIERPTDKVDVDEPVITPAVDKPEEKLAEPKPPSAVEPEEAVEDEEELLRVARLKKLEKPSALREDIPAPPPVTEQEPEGRKWLDKWPYMFGAVVIALVAAWLFWPEGRQPLAQVMLPEVEVAATVGTEQDQVTIISDEQPVVAVDTVSEAVAVLPVEEPEPVKETIQEPVAKPAPDKLQSKVKTLPLRNLGINRQAMDLFKSGDYWEAASIWGQEKKLRPAHYTIILLFGCEETTIKNAYRQLDKPADFFLLPRYINDRQCYTICWGDFTALSAARQWFGEIPRWFADNGAKPMIRSFSKIRMTTKQPMKVKKAATIIPVQKVEIESPIIPESDLLVVTDPISKLDDTDTLKPELPEVEKQFTEPAIVDEITSVEEAFIDAMIAIPQTDVVADTLPVEEPVIPVEPVDSVIVLLETDRDDDWIEMDTTTLLLEPKAEATGEEFVNITDLDIAETPLPEPEPEPDYTPQDLLELGRFVEAAGIWEIQKGTTPKNYTIKLLVACQEGSINDAYRALNKPPDFFILPRIVQGQACYAVCWGDFASKRDAKRRLKEVPKWFKRSGDKPVMTTFAKIYK